MNGKAQVQLEFLIMFGVLLGIIALFLGALETLHDATLKGASEMQAEANAQKCAALADSIYSNDISGNMKMKTNCYSETKNYVKSSVEGIEKSAFAIPKNIMTIQTSDGVIFEIQTGTHYG